MDEWDYLVASLDPRAIATRIIAECTTFDFAALRADPFSSLLRSPEIAVEIEESLVDTGCGGGGYYRPSPPTIHLHPATSRRDNFTLLHELCHHLQQSHPRWAYSLMDLPGDRALKIEEGVCDEFAAQVLLPIAAGDRHLASVHPADAMAGLFARSEASRPVILRGVLNALPPGSRWILAVADLDGRVTASGHTYDDPQPPRDFVQHGFRIVAEEAFDHSVRREFHEGIEYRTGAVLDDLRVEAALDHEERYVFLALTPTTISGSGTWTYPAQECSNSACGSSFQAKRSSGRCEWCQDFKCPDCKRCACTAPPRPTRCSKCFMEYTPAEMASGKHDCY